VLPPDGPLDAVRAADFPPALLARAAAVRLLLSDVDGVWTDGRILVHADGSESVFFHATDGFGVRKLIAAGIEIAVVSGRDNPAVAHRCRSLGVEEIHLGHLRKAEVVRQLIEARSLAPEQVAVIGDDLPDLPMFAAAGLRIAPPQAVPAILALADHVTRAPGGRGALREACELLIAAR